MKIMSLIGAVIMALLPAMALAGSDCSGDHRAQISCPTDSNWDSISQSCVKSVSS